MNHDLASKKRCLGTTLTMLSILLSILFFYFSNEVIKAQDRLNTQAFNMTLFLSQHNIIMTTSESLPADFLRTSYTHYSLAAYGTVPNISELESINNKSDYLQKFDDTKRSKVYRVNIAMNELTEGKDMLTKGYHATFIILMIVQFSAALLSTNRILIKLKEFFPYRG
ncbi:MAG: hypothetical protein HY001_04105 [Candidatus Portnoybacteria bacterium]|nr:hypothetical protein [Candidatus Portnoybacteria bacterium]